MRLSICLGEVLLSGSPASLATRCKPENISEPLLTLLIGLQAQAACLPWDHKVAHGQHLRCPYPYATTVLSRSNLPGLSRLGMSISPPTFMHRGTSTKCERLSWDARSLGHKGGSRQAMELMPSAFFKKYFPSSPSASSCREEITRLIVGRSLVLSPLHWVSRA
jgi:hypothetical protein